MDRVDSAVGWMMHSDNNLLLHYCLIADIDVDTASEIYDTMDIDSHD